MCFRAPCCCYLRCASPPPYSRLHISFDCAQSHYIFTFVFEDGSELLMWMGDRWQPDGPDSIGAASYVSGSRHMPQCGLIAIVGCGLQWPWLNLSLYYDGVGVANVARVMRTGFCITAACSGSITRLVPVHAGVAAAAAAHWCARL